MSQPRSGSSADTWRAGKPEGEPTAASTPPAPVPSAAPWRAGPAHPLVGITADLAESTPATPGAPTRLRAVVPVTYLNAVVAAGGVPVLLPPLPELVREYCRRCDAFVLTGGDDPRTESFGETTHPKATPMHPQRQAFEIALLDELQRRPVTPVLGVCLGMQLMALHAGGKLNQHLPDDLPTHEQHRHDSVHPVALGPDAPGHAIIVPGSVTSHHRQAVSNAGKLRVVARAPDGVIEAVDDPFRPFYLGVQWHPERTEFEPLGIRIFEKLVQAVRGGA